MGRWNRKWKWDGGSGRKKRGRGQRQYDDMIISVVAPSPEDEFVADYNEIERYEWYYFSSHPMSYCNIFERELT